jgi:hypothetical protein
MGRRLSLFFLILAVWMVVVVPAFAQTINQDADRLVVSVKNLTPGEAFDATSIETDFAILGFARDHNLDVRKSMQYITPAVERYISATVKNEGLERSAVVEEMQRSPGLRRLLGYVAAYNKFNSASKRRMT